ncbi:MAG: uncharacterized SAM-binding protein YcdF (DUF218 family) [Myxococcota bacterium]|jgi:uncharacterized SAM-binding protein YcdF (DUF218 family)
MGLSWRAAVAVAAAVVLGLGGWLGHDPLGTAVGAQLVEQDELHRSDAIVVLGGDARHRAPQGAALYRQGLAPVVLAVGGTQADGHYQAWRTHEVLRQQGVPDRAILVASQHEASTMQEAQAVVDHALDRSWRRIIVVTSPYHTWRAGEVFRDILTPHDVEVHLSAAPEDPFDPRQWWVDPRQRRQVRNEYLKLALWTLVRRG